MIETTNKLNFDFLGKRMIALIIFIVLSITGIISYLHNGLTLGTDFAGGIRIEFTAPSTVQEIRILIPDTQISITTLTQNNGVESFLITAPSEFEESGSGDHLLNPLRKKYKEANIVVLSSEYIGPSVGNDFAKQALKLLSIVTALILVYVAFRFDFIYGMGAICALLHDMTILLIFTVILQIPINLTILAAFLTILGYSINDTIVIFDRIRENHTLLPQENFYNIINKSISQTLTRTVLTSTTTLFVAGSIYIWSGNILQNFGLLLIIGVITGTYSSIFVAPPISLFLFNKTHKIIK
ncbi:MAG: protein translocase subunit SecF [Spirochaetota bacterium]|nr:protein translocase subunit SecF [Spirochaetota bacterium]